MTAFWTPDDITAEFQIDGSYTQYYDIYDLSTRVRGSDAIRITRGTADQQSAFSPGSAAFSLNNRDGLFCGDNPNSVLYNKIGINSRVRLGIQRNAQWDEACRLPEAYEAMTDTHRAVTLDQASLDITGDIDVRMEFTPNYTRGKRQTLGGKYQKSGNQRSWILELGADGRFAFTHSTDGTLAGELTNTISSSAALAVNAGRQAIRVTMDVNNGAGGRDYKWYTSDSITGTWTLVSSTTVAATTSIYSSSALPEVGSVNGGGNNDPYDDSFRFAGKVYSFQVYDGIGGTKVLDFTPTGQGIETTVWVDNCASPNTWFVVGANLRLTSDRVRVTGELTSLPSQWDGTGADVWIPCTLAGVGARLGTNKAPLRSALYRWNTNSDNWPYVVGYWPLEDNSDAVQAGAPNAAGFPGVVNAVTFTEPTGYLTGSAGSLKFSTAATSYAQFRGTPDGTSDYSSITFYYRIGSVPASSQVFAQAFAANAGYRWDIAYNLTNGVTVSVYGRDGALLGTAYNTLTTGTVTVPADGWTMYQLTMYQQSAGVINWNLWSGVIPSGQPATFVTGVNQLAAGGLTYSGTVGKGFYGFDMYAPVTAYEGSQVAHVTISQSQAMQIINGMSDTDPVRWPAYGNAGEAAGQRIRRLTEEEGIRFDWLGNLDDTSPCGAQTADNIVTLCTAAQKVDGGIFGEIRDVLGFRYVTRNYLGNRRGLELSYGDSELFATPVAPVDNRYTVNDFTASRTLGSSARYEATDDRKLNVRDPDDASPGVGRWEKADTFNAATDDQLPTIAQGQVSLGTWPGRRIPNLSVALHRKQIADHVTKYQDLLAVDCGDPITLTDLSGLFGIPPDDLLMILFGYTEILGGMTDEWTANTVPGGPYQVPVLTANDVQGYPLLDAVTTTVDGAHNTTTTTIAIKTPDTEPYWVYAAAYPNDIGGGVTLDASVAGEQVTISAISAPSASGGFNHQNLTVTRSVNSIVKAPADGDPVFLYTPFYLGYQ
jgi:hypothetical protein